jgi:perosamine synthetase
MINISSVELAGNEKKYVNECLDDEWISSTGKFVDKFEQQFSSIVGVNHSATCSNGTVALHLALLALGIGPGDEVIVPAFTYVASVNAIRYVGATPVLVDSTPGSLVMDLEKVADAITPRTKAVMPVHIYGHPVDMDSLRSIVGDSIYLIEDAAEALGSLYKGKSAGSLGDLATFSFYGNKVITTGEGGMVTSQDSNLDSVIRLYRGQGQNPQKRFWHDVVGYNYRLTNIQSAIGVAQLENLSSNLNRRQEIRSIYNEVLLSVEDQFSELKIEPWAQPACWLYSGMFYDDSGTVRDRVAKFLEERKIETRPLFYVVNDMPAHSDLIGSFPVAKQASQNGISLPTHTKLTNDEIFQVASQLVQCIKGE